MLYCLSPPEKAAIRNAELELKAHPELAIVAEGEPIEFLPRRPS
jgi:hypothetical protein